MSKGRWSQAFLREKGKMYFLNIIKTIVKCERKGGENNEKKN
jgi:hypothetical protein